MIRKVVNVTFFVTSSCSTTKSSQMAKLLLKLLYTIRTITLLLCGFLLLHVLFDSNRFQYVSFENPLLGFEARGTELADRIHTWNLLRKNFDRLFTRRPPVDLTAIKHEQNASVALKRVQMKVNVKVNNQDNETETDASSPSPSSPFDRVHFDSNRMFCGTAHEDYAHLTFNSDQDILSFPLIRSLCKLDRQLRAVNEFSVHCELNSKRECCGSWSLPNYIAYIIGRESCDQIQPSDVITFRQLLQSCAPAYQFTLKSSGCVADNRLCGVAVGSPCASHRIALFSVFHYLLDRTYSYELATMNPATMPRLRQTGLFLPLPKSIKLLTVYEQSRHILNQMQSIIRLPIALNYSTMPWLQKYTKQEDLTVQSVDFGVYQTLFERHLIVDLQYGAFALVAICIICYLYTGSLLVTIAILASISFSPLISYYAYVYGLNIQFFPFMNMFAVLIAIAIGADNAFIFVQEYRQVNYYKVSQNYRDHIFKADPGSHIGDESYSEMPSTHNVKLHDKYSTKTTLLGSSTSMIAFACSFYSNVTAVQCFALFAALVTICNFALTLLFLPCCIQAAKASSVPNLKFKRTKSSLCKLLFYLIRWFAIPIVFFFASLALIAFYLIFYYPSLKPAYGNESALFRANHHFETYTQSKSQYPFDRPTVDDNAQSYFFGQNQNGAHMILGVSASDTGFQLDPLDRGSVVFSDFDPFDQNTQKWLFDYCGAIRNQSFYTPQRLAQFPGCFMETFKTWMSERSCDRQFGTEDSYPCCNRNRFPYPPEVFRTCLTEYQYLLERTPSQLVSKFGGFWFIRNDSDHSAIAQFPYNKSSPDPIPRLLVIDMQLQIPSTSNDFSYTETYRLWSSFSKFQSRMLASAPESLLTSWVIVDNLDYFAFRVALLESVPGSIILAACLSAVAVALSTRLISLTLFAFTSISFSIGCTIAFLVVIDWRLDVTESVIITSTIGLSVDYTLHYAMAYKNAVQVLYSLVFFNSMQSCLRQIFGLTE